MSRTVKVNIPMMCVAEIDVDTSTAVGVSFVPLEGDAGYFGQGSSLIEWDDNVTEDEAGKALMELWGAPTDWSILGSLGEGIEWVG